MMIKALDSKSSSSSQLKPEDLWYVPHSHLKTKAAVSEAVKVAGWVQTGCGFDAEPDEITLFVALHTCAYQAVQAAHGKRVAKKQWDKWSERWRIIRERIVERNLGLVYSMISRFGSRKLDEDELLSDSLFGLARAIDRFNPWKGFRFSTYACNVVARTLMRRGKEESKYRRLFPVQHETSFERPENEPDAQLELYVERLNRVLDNNIGELTELELRIVSDRFPEDRQRRLTFQQIGDSIGLSKERVRQIQNIALTKLRSVLEADPILQ